MVVPQTGARSDGGVESLTEIMLRAGRVRPVALTNLETERTARWRAAGIETHVAPFAGGAGHASVRDLGAYVRYAAIISRLLRQSGARVVHANGPLAMQLAVVPARIAQARLIFNVRDTPSDQRAVSGRKYTLLFQAAHHILFLSRDMAARWSRIARVPPSRWSATYSIVDHLRFDVSEAPKDHPPVVLVAGVVREKKGQLPFLREAAPTIIGEGNRVRLVGDFHPDQEAYAEACAKAAAPYSSAVEFAGFSEDLPAQLGRATVLAVTSLYEGLVRVMIEAMASGRPVVSFDISSAREILEDSAPGAGRIVPVGDYVALADAINHYCAAPTDAAAAGAAGREAAIRLFDERQVVARYERAWLNAAGAEVRQGCDDEEAQA